MDNSKHNGFTMIELLIALAVAAILLAVGIPSFSGAIKNSQVSADYNGLLQSLYMARSEAVKRTASVSMCPKKEIDSTECGAGLHDWKNGWLVFIDASPTNNIEDNPEIGAEDEIILVHEEIRSQNTIKAIGSVDRTQTTYSDKTYIQFRATGTAAWGNGTFEICNSDEDELSRTINIAPTGDVRPGRNSGGTRPVNIFGDEVC